MDSLGPGEILLIVAAIALLFGAKRLPEVARSLGRARSEFRKGLEEGERSAASNPSEGQAQPPASPQPDEGQVGPDQLTPGPGS